ncbi:MAG: Nif3-like dinuclear metal center hexameric protein [Veillonellaceae bacterium]|jgi:dinuclear metal center YbgI/SA1388 family protein|nr:Nif3-like dinuclear metal center hexameric protein [Veillonellaceae bacterium]
MPIKCQSIINELEKLAPRDLAEDWDNVGLLVGSPDQDISKILIALDVTDNVVDQAITNNSDMIVTHHPLIFKGIKNIRTDLPHGKLLAKLIKNDIAVYTAHTNLDIAAGGINDILASKLNLTNVQSLSPGHSEKLLKLAVFVPDTHAEAVRAAICDAGAGHVGNYSHCTFQTDGTGTFMPLEGTNPFLGSQGELEQVREVRLETVMSEKICNKVIKAMLKAHPYEEVAYDLYQLANTRPQLGLGRIGSLSAPKSLAEFVDEVKQALGINLVNVAGPENKSIWKVAVCGGSGASLIHSAAFAGADVLVTGDVKYHEAQEAVAAGIVIVDAGHFATEVVIVDYLSNYLGAQARNEKWGIEIITDNIRTDIFRRY